MLRLLVRRNAVVSSSGPCRLVVSLFSFYSVEAAPGTISMAEHLVSSWGLSEAVASRASKSLARLKSTENPDAVLKFLRSQGFHSSHLDRIVGMLPILLCRNVEKTLAPQFRSLREIGFSESDLVDIIPRHSCLINQSVHNIVLPKLQFWECLLGSREVLLKFLKKQRLLLGSEKRVNLNLKFLRNECGISRERVSLVVRKTPRFILQSLDSLRALVRRADEFGVPRHSKTFLWTLFALRKVSRDTVNTKLKLMMKFGLTESEILTAVRMAPSLLGLSQEELHKKMEFFINEVGLMPSCIAHQPTHLLYSLEKRVIPRFRAMEILKSKGLCANLSLLTYLILPNPKFIEKFILPNEENVPELLKIISVAGKGG